MGTSVIETYAELWHYTDASGLQGILDSQQLWATNIFYLNDVEEYTGFFDRRLMKIIQSGITDAINAGLKTQAGIDAIAKNGGPEFFLNEWADVLLDSLKVATISKPAYVTSFCSTPEDLTSNDGLLSQWRGYGRDGGYAIVFDTRGLNDLLVHEDETFLYAFAHWGDVDYYDAGNAQGRVHKETQEWEKEIREITSKYIQFAIKDLTHFPKELVEKYFVPVFSLATRHKHRGFQEEREVRIVIFDVGEKDVEAAQEQGDQRQRKTVKFVRRGGVLVPYVSLFERLNGKLAKLPIKKIIVGPHPDKIKRKEALEMLLVQKGVNARVVASEIPYIGR